MCCLLRCKTHRSFYWNFWLNCYDGRQCRERLAWEGAESGEVQVETWAHEALTAWILWEGRLGNSGEGGGQG